MAHDMHHPLDMMKHVPIVTTLVWALLLAPSVLLTGGCEPHACAPFVCDDQANIMIRGFEADQTYEVEVETSGDVVQCDVDTNGEMRIMCDGNVLFSQVYANEAQILVNGMPDRVVITVWQNGAVIAREEVQPSYYKSRGCDAECWTGEAPVEL